MFTATPTVPTAHAMIASLGIMKNDNRVMISGQTDLSEEMFDMFYAPVIESHIMQDASFMMGTASGVDAMAKKYLLSRDVSPNKITLVFKKDVGACVDVTNIGGNFATYPDRDSFMTQNTDVDIAYINGSYMSIGSGTMSNIFRRRYGHTIATALTAHIRGFTPVAQNDDDATIALSLYDVLRKFDAGDGVDHSDEIYKMIKDASMLFIADSIRLWPQKN